MCEMRSRKLFGAPGKGGPAGFASYSPRPPLLRGFTKEKGIAKSTPKAKPSDGVAATRGSVADAFFGASPVVASALGAAPGAIPAQLIEPIIGGSGNYPKPELSTLLGTGTFYFALTDAAGEMGGLAARVEDAARVWRPAAGVDACPTKRGRW